MALTLGVDLHKTARFVNIALVILLPVAFLAGYGYYVSFHFHFLNLVCGTIDNQCSTG